MKAKKILGQHFLSSRRALSQIIGAGKIEPGETVLEIGPGRGVLTAGLLHAGARIVAVEKDRELISLLEKTFEKELADGELKLVEGDALALDMHSLGIRAGEYKIIANIPYYITGQFLRKFLSGIAQPKSMVLLLQKEVVSRIIARDEKESLLSLSVKAYGKPQFVGKVSARDFRPAPKVDSAIIAIENISKKNFGGRGGEGAAAGAMGEVGAARAENNFFTILHAGFAHKRKKLIRNLEAVANKEKIEKAFNECEVATDTRAEDLPLEKWKCLAEKIFVI